MGGARTAGPSQEGGGLFPTARITEQPPPREALWGCERNATGPPPSRDLRGSRTPDVAERQRRVRLRVSTPQERRPGEQGRGDRGGSLRRPRSLAEPWPGRVPACRASSSLSSPGPALPEQQRLQSPHAVRPRPRLLPGHPPWRRSVFPTNLVSWRHSRPALSTFSRSCGWLSPLAVTCRAQRPATTGPAALRPAVARAAAPRCAWPRWAPASAWPTREPQRCLWSTSLEVPAAVRSG